MEITEFIKRMEDEVQKNTIKKEKLGTIEIINLVKEELGVLL